MDTSTSTPDVGGIPHAPLLDGLRFAPDATVVVAPSGRIEGANDRVVDLLGCAPADLVGQRFDDLIDTSVVSTGQPSWTQRFARGEVPDRAELALRGVDRPTLPVDVTFARIPTTAGLRYILALRDATRSVRERAASRRRDAILEAVAFAGESLLWSDDWAGTVRAVLERLGRATEVSRVYVYALGDDGTTLSRRYEWAADGLALVTGDPVATELPIHAPVARRWVKGLRAGQTIHGPLGAFAEDEQALLRLYSIESLVLSPIQTGEVLWGFVGFDDCVQPREWSVVEVGALRVAASVLGSALIQQVHRSALADSEQAYADAYQLERRQTMQLRTIDGLKDALLETVSFELRTPLAALLSFTEVIRQHGGSLSPEETTMLLDRLHDTAVEMDLRLRNLLDLDRVTRGRLRPHPQRVRLDAVLQEAVAACDPLRGRPVEISGDTLHALVDPEHLRRILDVLLRNTSRHTPPGTPVWVTADATPDATVEVRVEDAGPGVPDRLRLALFRTPSLQDADPVSATGLPLVAWLAVLNGGAAWVEDRTGGGASFRVSLPAA